MSDIRKLLEQQAAWQKERAKLTWAQKIRMAEAVRETVASFSHRRQATAPPKRTPGHFLRGSK